jgi:hypothetical protein
LNQKQLIKLVLPWKQRVTIDKLAHNATDSPQINFLPVFSPHKQFRRPVPPSRHVVCQILVLLPPDLSGKPEIAYFETLLAADQQIFGFDVPVHNILLVEVGQPF